MLKSLAITMLAGASMAAYAAGDKEWKATLAPQNGSQLNGSAEVESKGADSTKMEVKIEKGAPGTSYDWHMHKGSCVANEGVAGDATLYPKLQTDSAGKGEIAAVLRVPAPATGEYSIHVHAPRADTSTAMGKTEACGDLKQS